MLHNKVNRQNQRAKPAKICLVIIYVQIIWSVKTMDSSEKCSNGGFFPNLTINVVFVMEL